MESFRGETLIGEPTTKPEVDVDGIIDDEEDEEDEATARLKGCESKLLFPTLSLSWEAAVPPVVVATLEEEEEAAAVGEAEFFTLGDSRCNQWWIEGLP